jgi:hypothetical protein
LASAILKFSQPEVGRKIFNSYNKFLETMNDSDKRTALAILEFEKANDPLFDEERGNTRLFRDGLEQLFFDADPRLARLTRRYGVF